MTDKKSPSALVLPFGKHKGSTVAELLTKDPAYAEWVANQGWVAERFAELHAAILSRGAATDDSPEHNAIQVRFLEKEFQVAWLLALNPKAIENRKAFIVESIVDQRTRSARNALETCQRNITYQEERIIKVQEILLNTDRPNKGIYPDSYYERSIAKHREELASNNDTYLSLKKELLETDRQPTPPIPAISTIVQFEQKGVDVTLHIYLGDYYVYGGDIEIKPTMGDDFPSVMRQMARLRSHYLVLGQYTGRAVSEPQLRQMFKANELTILFVSDIEAEIANARAELAT